MDLTFPEVGMFLVCCSPVVWACHAYEVASPLTGPLFAVEVATGVGHSLEGLPALRALLPTPSRGRWLYNLRGELVIVGTVQILQGHRRIRLPLAVDKV